VIRVDDFHVVRCLDITCSDNTFAVLAQAQRHFITVVQLEHHTLEVQQDVDHILLNTIDGRVLVQNACDSDFRRCVTHHGREQDTPNGVAQCVTIATLERLQALPWHGCGQAVRH
jgi:hypothetical protein